MSRVTHLFGLGLAAVLLAAAGTGAQELSALARLAPDQSSVESRGAVAKIRLGISQPVPWRVRLLADPPRLILDVREVDWTGMSEVALNGPAVIAARAGVFRPGWSRLVLELSAPHAIRIAEMATTGEGAMIRIDLAPTDPESFARAAARPEPQDWALPEPSQMPEPAVRGNGQIVVVLDPGHGGIDPGAERGDLTEAGLMLTFARELKEHLLRDGRFSVVMTREEDVFVPLEARVSIARAAEADVFLSLHADALAEGEAQGATVYTLSAEASDEAAAALAERHDRDDLLAGVDLSGQDDLVAEILMDMARTETDPRTRRLAEAVMATIKAAELRIHRNPVQSAGFSVLKSPDIPSVLLEVGFLSSSRDLKRLNDPEWRARMAEAIRLGLIEWVTEDASLGDLRAP
ncbi:MAG: N-acetylmuramoyl-L-alanine amidase [Tabrizicola sp.]|nr:N-acetylmuramoyl-L-alanine amidase [Tabrizicola sp.]